MVFSHAKRPPRSGYVQVAMWEIERNPAAGGGASLGNGTECRIMGITGFLIVGLVVGSFQKAVFRRSDAIRAN